MLFASRHAAIVPDQPWSSHGHRAAGCLAALPHAGVNTDTFAQLSRLREANAGLDAAIAAARERAARPIPPLEHVRHAIDDADRQLAVTRDVFAGYRGWIGADARTRLAGAARLRRCVDGVDTDRMEPRASTYSEAHVDAEPDRRGTRTADLVATIIGLLLLVPWVLWLAWQGAWIGALTGLCQSSACRNDAIETGMAFAVYGPVAVWVLALVASIVRLALRRTAWWIPLVGFLLAIVVQRFGGWIADGG